MKKQNFARPVPPVPFMGQAFCYSGHREEKRASYSQKVKNGQQEVEEMEKVICRELTWMGWILCGMAGFMELAFVFLVLGISWRMTPVLVFLFLWLLFSLLSAGAVLEFEEILDRGKAGLSVYSPRSEKLVLEKKYKV